MTTDARRRLEARFVRTLTEWNGPFVSRVDRPWWVDLLEFLPPDDPPGVIGTEDDRSIKRVIQTLEPLRASTSRLPEGVARRIALPPHGTVAAAASTLIAVLAEEAQAWLDEREPDYARFAPAIIAGRTEELLDEATSALRFLAT